MNLSAITQDDGGRTELDASDVGHDTAREKRQVKIRSNLIHRHRPSFDAELVNKATGVVAKAGRRLSMAFRLPVRGQAPRCDRRLTRFERYRPGGRIANPSYHSRFSNPLSARGGGGHRSAGAAYGKTGRPAARVNGSNQ